MQGMDEVVPYIWGKEFENEGAAWIEAKWILPMLSLDGCQNGVVTETAYESLNPKVAFAWL